MMACWNVIPEERPSFTDILSGLNEFAGKIKNINISLGLNGWQELFIPARHRQQASNHAKC
jgi:hypothetical protein